MSTAIAPRCTGGRRGQTSRSSYSGVVSYQSEQGLQELRAFVAVVEAGGIVAAARAFKGQTPSFSRRVHDLETRLGVPLIERTSTRTLQLTDEGQAYYEHAARALAAVNDAEAVVFGATAAPRGLLRVSTSTAMATFVLDTVVPRYLAEHAGVCVDVEVSDARENVVTEGYDLAIWTGARATAAAVRTLRVEAPDAPLKAHVLGVVGTGFFASPAYLAKRVAPKSVEGLAAHDTIAVARGAASHQWAVVVDGVKDTIALRPRLIVSDVQRAVRAAALGLGIVRAPTSVAALYVARGELVAVMDTMSTPGLDVFVVVPARGPMAARTRAFIALLEQCLLAMPSM